MRRSDDTADKLRSRLKAFHQQTQPVIDYYERAGKTVNIDAKQDKNVRTLPVHGRRARVALFDKRPRAPRSVCLHERAP